MRRFKTISFCLLTYFTHSKYTFYMKNVIVLFQLNLYKINSSCIIRIYPKSKSSYKVQPLQTYEEQTNDISLEQY